MKHLVLVLGVLLSLSVIGALVQRETIGEYKEAIGYLAEELEYRTSSYKLYRDRIMIYALTTGDTAYIAHLEIVDSLSILIEDSVPRRLKVKPTNDDSQP